MINSLLFYREYNQGDLVSARTARPSSGEVIKWGCFCHRLTVHLSGFCLSLQGRVGHPLAVQRPQVCHRLLLLRCVNVHLSRSGFLLSAHPPSPARQSAPSPCQVGSEPRSVELLLNDSCQVNSAFHRILLQQPVAGTLHVAGMSVRILSF